MPSFQSFALRGLCLVPALLLVACGQRTADANPSPDVQAMQRQIAALQTEVAALKAKPAAAPAGHAAHAADPRQAPDVALALLVDGNRAFVAGRPNPADLGAARRSELAGGQHPFAVVLGCADSRSSTEHLFQAGLGDLFVIRSAGNTAFDAAVASTEYAVAHLGAQLVVVLGHSACGAVKAAIADNHETPAVGRLVDSLTAAVRQARSQGGPGGDAELVERSVVCNALAQRDALLAASALLRQRHADGQLRLVVAKHDLASGEVSWIDLDGLAAPAPRSAPQAHAAARPAPAPAAHPAPAAPGHGALPPPAVAPRAGGPIAPRPAMAPTPAAAPSHAAH